MIYNAYPFHFVFGDFPDHTTYTAYFDLEFNVFHGRVDVYDVELISVAGTTDPKVLDKARELFDKYIEDGGVDTELLLAAESWGEMDEYYGIEDAFFND